MKNNRMKKMSLLVMLFLFKTNRMNKLLLMMIINKTLLLLLLLIINKTPPPLLLLMIMIMMDWYLIKNNWLKIWVNYNRILMMNNWGTLKMLHLIWLIVQWMRKDWIQVIRIWLMVLWMHIWSGRSKMIISLQWIRSST